MSFVVSVILIRLFSCFWVSLPILAKYFDWLGCWVQPLTSLSLWFYHSQHVHVPWACRNYSASPKFHCFSYCHFSFSHNTFNFAVLRFLYFQIQVEWMPYGCWYKTSARSDGICAVFEVADVSLNSTNKIICSRFVFSGCWASSALRATGSRIAPSSVTGLQSFFFKDLQSQLFQAVHFWTYITVDRVSSQVQCQIFLRHLRSIGTHVDWWSCWVSFVVPVFLIRLFSCFWNSLPILAKYFDWLHLFSSIINVSEPFVLPFSTCSRLLSLSELFS